MNNSHQSVFEIFLTMSNTQHVFYLLRDYIITFKD